MKVELDKNLYLVAQAVTDKVMGPGAYAELNGFDPSKGEFPEQIIIECVGHSMIERMTKYGFRTKVVLACGCYRYVRKSEIKREQLFIGKRVPHNKFQK